MSGEDHPEQEREQGGGCWSLPEILRDSQLAARCGVCLPGRARGSRRAWSSAGGGVVSCGGQENQFGLKPYPSSCILPGAHLRPPRAWQGKECLPVEMRCWVFRSISASFHMFHRSLS